MIDNQSVQRRLCSLQFQPELLTQSFLKRGPKLGLNVLFRRRCLLYTSGAGDIAEEGVDFAGGFGAIFEQEHVAFGDEPVAEVDAAEGDGMSGSVDDLSALAVEEAGFGGGEGEGGEGRE